MLTPIPEIKYYRNIETWGRSQITDRFFHSGWSCLLCSLCLIKTFSLYDSFLLLQSKRIYGCCVDLCFNSLLSTKILQPLVFPQSLISIIRSTISSLSVIDFGTHTPGLTNVLRILSSFRSLSVLRPFKDVYSLSVSLTLSVLLRLLTFPSFFLVSLL